MLRSTSSIQYSGGGIGLKSAGIIAQSGAPSSVTGTLSLTTLATVIIPANSVGPNGSIRIIPLFEATNNANTKTGHVALGGSDIWTPNLVSFQDIQSLLVVRNKGVQNAQVTFNGNNGIGTGGVTVSTSINLTQQQNLTFSAQLTNTADTVTLLAYTVEILNP